MSSVAIYSPVGGDPAAFSPVAIVDYSARSSSPTLVVPLLGGGVAVVVRKSHPRSGRLGLLFDTSAAAHAAVVMLTMQRTFILSGTVTELNMPRFAVVEAVAVAKHDDLPQWIVEVPFQEVPA